MPPTKPQSNPQKKPVRKVKILQVKSTQHKSLLAEHFYAFLGILFAVSTFLLMGFGLRADESAVVGLWIVGIIFFIRQAVRFVKGEQAQTKQVKKATGPQPVKKYVPPALPRVSKDFSPMPPAGDKRYPPPSPFIKPPK
jgi:hypothetical protein